MAFMDCLFYKPLRSKKVKSGNCKLQIANCKLVFLYVSVCITPKGSLRVVILLACKVIIYYYNNIINNIIYIIYIIYINTFGK